MTANWTMKPEMPIAHDAIKSLENVSASEQTSSPMNMVFLWSLRAEFLASLQARSAPCSALVMSVGCGQMPSESLANYDPLTQSLKTRQMSLFCQTSTESLDALPRSGMIVGGSLFRLPSLVPDISVTDSLFFLPTPTCRDWKDTPGMAMEVVVNGNVERTRTDQLPRRIYSHANAPLATGTRLNPLFSLWLMGFPDDWLAPLSTALGTPFCRNLPK